MYKIVRKIKSNGTLVRQLTFAVSKRLSNIDIGAFNDFSNCHSNLLFKIIVAMYIPSFTCFPTSKLGAGTPPIMWFSYTGVF